MSARGRNTHVTHTERFATVTSGAAALTVQSFAINPGLNSVFPWMCDVANRFDKYKFSSLKFQYVPAISTATTGGVALVFDFDPNDPAPTVMEDATTYHDYVTAPIWQAASLSVDLANGDKLPQKDTRPGLPAANYDLNNYDVGNLYVMTNGTAAAAVVGYVEVTYSVELMIHQTQDGVGGRGVATAGLTQTALVGTNFTADDQAILPVIASAANTFTFIQPWEGVLTWALSGTTISAAITVGGTATSQLTNSYCFLADGSYSMNVIRVRATTGQTFIPTTTAAAIASSTVYFGASGYEQCS